MTDKFHATFDAEGDGDRVRSTTAIESDGSLTGALGSIAMMIAVKMFNMNRKTDQGQKIDNASDIIAAVNVMAAISGAGDPVTLGSRGIIKAHQVIESANSEDPNVAIQKLIDFLSRTIDGIGKIQLEDGTSNLDGSADDTSEGLDAFSDFIDRITKDWE